MTFASAIAIGILALMGRGPRIDLQPFFGGVPPLVGGTIVALLGVSALFLLQTRFGFCVWRHSTPKRFAVAALLAVPFMVVVTILDLTAGFPADINVPFPTALLFYPAMGLFAQLSLHVVPFAAVLLAKSPLHRHLSMTARFWLAIILASLIEAAFQVRGPFMQDGEITAQAAVLTLHIFLFGCVELVIYRRYDFAAMYAFRMTYYAYWHVIWGVLRLQG